MMGSVLSSSVIQTRPGASEPNRRSEPQDDHQFKKPNPRDSRSPCPALNVLANHGYLPRDGKNITAVMLTSATQVFMDNSVL